MNDEDENFNTRAEFVNVRTKKKPENRFWFEGVNWDGRSGISSNNISEDFEFSIAARGEYVTYIVCMLRVILSYRKFWVDVKNENFDTHRIINNNAF